jgi:DNA-binding response OmpR family regulator
LIDLFERLQLSNVNDDPDIVTIRKQGLMRLGFHIFAFTDPNLALKHFGLNYRNHGLVIFDISMPKMNGFEFIKKSEANKTSG